MPTTDPIAGSADTRPDVVELALALPGVALLAVTALVCLAALAGAGPLWPVIPLTLPEAAAMHDDAEILKLVGAGADVNAPDRVRAETLVHDERMFTPLEAAVGARQPQTMRVLLDHGARLDESNWTRLVCFAQRLEAEEVVALLTERLPGRSMPDCSGVSLPFEP